MRDWDFMLVQYDEAYHTDDFIDDDFRNALTKELRHDFGATWGFSAEPEGVVCRGHLCETFFEIEGMRERMRELVEKTMILTLVQGFASARLFVASAKESEDYRLCGQCQMMVAVDAFTTECASSVQSTEDGLPICLDCQSD